MFLFSLALLPAGLETLRGNGQSIEYDSYPDPSTRKAGASNWLDSLDGLGILQLLILNFKVLTSLI